MITLNEIARKGITKIYNEHKTEQRYFLNVIANQVRGMESNILEETESFFVPNEDYIVTMFGDEALDYKYGFYLSSGKCLWTQTLMIPIFNVIDEIVGFVGFIPEEYILTKTEQIYSKNYYTYSHKTVFDKGKYLFWLKGTFNKAIKDGYIIITDGLFDTLSLSALGYNSASALGSSITIEILVQLSFIKKVIVAMDNDEAGLKLYNKLKSHLHQVVYLKQDLTKDVDEFLKHSNLTKLNYIKALDHCIQNEYAIGEVLYTGQKQD